MWGISSLARWPMFSRVPRTAAVVGPAPHPPIFGKACKKGEAVHLSPKSTVVSGSG